MAKAKALKCVDPDAPLLESSYYVLSTRVGELLAYDHYVPIPQAVEPLHAMRIAAKRLRYTLAIFQEIYTEWTPYGPAVDRAVEAVKELQEHLGALHDADVLVPQLAEHVANLLRPGYGESQKGVPVAGVHQIDFNACQGLLTLCVETRAERDAHHAQLAALWEQLRANQVFETLLSCLQDAALSGDDLEPPPAASGESGQKEDKKP